MRPYEMCIRDRYKAATGREQRRDADVLCYQIRQSFKPGEITPEEANRIGYEPAMQMCIRDSSMRVSGRWTRCGERSKCSLTASTF